MSVALDHMRVPARDNVATAEWYARIFGVRYEGPRRDYAPVSLSDGLTLNFESSDTFEMGHYAFRTGQAEFQAVLDRLVEAGVLYGTSTRAKDGAVYERGGLRGFFFQDPNGRSLEIITKQ